MLVTNGITTRSITAKQLPEYEAKGYKEVNIPVIPKPSKTGKK